MANIFDDEWDNNFEQNNEPPFAQQRITNRPREQVVRPVRKNRARNKWTQGLPTGRLELGAVTFVLFMVMWALGWQLMPFNKVNYVAVSGVELSNTNQIIASSTIRTLDSVKDVMKQRDQIEEAIIEANPMVSSIVLERPSWSHININVTEYKVIAMAVVNNEELPVLENGEFIKQNNDSFVEINNRSNFPTIINVAKKGDIVTIASALRRIEPEVLSLIDTIQVNNETNNPNNLILKMKDGLTVKAIRTTLAEKINKYPQMKAIIGEQKGTLNLEVGAYFIPEQNSANSVKLDTNIDN